MADSKVARKAFKRKNKSFSSPLAGLRILDLTRLYPGPLGTMLLADMGADVIKIEDIHKPDYIRSFPFFPFKESEAASYLAVNRSKRSLVVDLNEEKGREIFFQLVKTADVVIEQFRPGVIAKIGLGYDAACKYNPRIIYVSVTGYGQDGPYANRAGHDINYIGYAGILAATGTPESGPVVPVPQLADVAGGAYMTAIASLSALWARERTGKGQKVDVAILDATLPLITLQMAHYWATGENPKWGESKLSGGLACYNVYETSDGKWVALGALEPKFWHQFCELVGKPEWKNMLYGQREEKEKLKGELTILFKTKTREEWMAMTAERDVCLSPILGFEEIEADSHLISRNMIVEQDHPVCGKIKSIGVPIKFSETSAEPSCSPPMFGEDTQEILTELGYSESEIAVLVKSGLVKIWPE